MRRIHSQHAYSDARIERCFWAEAVPDNKLSRPALSGTRKADVAIIGGGYTGLSAALHLARDGVNVVLLEARFPGWGASGRNGGFCCLGGASWKTSRLIAPMENPHGWLGGWPRNARFRLFVL